MQLHPKALDRARRIDRQLGPRFPYFSDTQVSEIRREALRLRRLYRRHPRLHDAGSTLLVAALLAADLWVVGMLPRLLPWSTSAFSGAVLCGVVCGALHGWFVCGIVTLTVHEGAAHGLLIQGRGPVARFLRRALDNVCRLFYADPEYYRAGHALHHRHFGTEEDGSFTNWVEPRRYLLSLHPAAPALSFSDYFPWRPREMTPSRRLSGILGKVTLGAYAVGAAVLYGPTYAIVAVVLVGAWVSFALDRTRESLEHLMMPLDRANGTRELGPGLWGLILGGGPWGQPCHLSHHLAPALPWYLQLRFHVFLRKLLTPAQRQAFLLPPIVGVPRLVWRWLRHARSEGTSDLAGAR